MQNDLVVKHNNLIQARYDLTLNQQKVIMHAISKVDTRDKKFNIIPIHVREFYKLLGTSTDRHTELRETINSLRDERLTIETERSTLVTGWLSSIEYIKESGVVEIEFSEKLVPYLLGLKQMFTRYQIKNILYLSNRHSIRIYELLKQYEVIGSRSFKVEELKRILMLDNQYQRFGNFENRVLKPSMEDINEHTDLIVHYEKIKTGRSITDIKYTIKAKSIDEELEYLKSNYNIDEIKRVSGLEDENFNSRQILNIYEKAVYKMVDEYEEEKDIFNYININYKDMADRKGIRNRYSYLMDYLEHDRAKAIVYIKEHKKSLLGTN